MGDIGQTGSSQTASGSGMLPRYERLPKGQHTRLIDENRLKGFISEGQWADINLRSMLYHASFKDPPNVKLFVKSIPDLARPKFAEAVKGEFRPAKVGEVFGPSWSTHWFRVHILVPSEWASAERVELHFDIGAEGLVWTAEGSPLHGLTGGIWRDRRVEFIIPRDWEVGKEHVFYIETSMNGMFGCHPEPRVMPKDGLDIGSFTKPPDPNRKFTLMTAELRVPNMDAWRLFWDYSVLEDIARTLPNNSWEAQRCWRAGVDIINAFRRGDSGSLLKGREIGRQLYGAEIDNAAGKNAEQSIIWAIGHCHIDTAWLWPFAETKRKVARSWSTQCDLMDRYKDHTFAASTAQQYLWLKEEYPGLFDRVKARVLEGRFIPVGGSWVEFDSHYACGESLIRQFLVGQRFFESNFGRRCETGWLPDTFGYSAQLPQLLRSAGMKFFFTQKISWNSVNTFPHTTFKWVGLDGTQVLTHMAPTDSYGAQVSAEELVMSVSNHKSLREDNTSMLLFGNGDGGGGPLPTMIEKLHRLQGLGENMGGSIHQVKISTPEDFFKQLEAKSETIKFATYHGDIYLESCRGCYTTQAKTKRNNRKAENYLHDVELLATCTSICNPGWSYPKRKLDDLWQSLLLCHFHDVLPGSAIEMVFEDADKIYADMFNKLDKIYAETTASLGAATTGQLVALNTFGWQRCEIIEIPAEQASDLATMSGAQKTASGGTLVAITATPNSVTSLQANSSPSQKAILTFKDDDTYVLENGKVRVTIEGGEITSFVDLDLDRELIPKGERGNKLVLFYDQAMTFWDAWDAEIYHLEMPEYLGAGSVRVLEQGPLRVSVEVMHQISEESWIKSIISLDAHQSISGSPEENGPQSLLKIECEVEWHECRRFLKVEFPWDIHNDHATYETQFGVIRTPTHYNTSWDYARFENVCHRFADLSEFGYGVSILNDSKYGFETQGNIQRLSLLRSPKGPDPNADMGRQRFKYAIAPHHGSFMETNIVRSGLNFNNELRLLRVADLESFNSQISSVSLEGPRNIILSNIKRGEDDEKLDGHYQIRDRPGKSIILRIYESLGGSGKAKIKTKFDVHKAFRTNILEDDEEELMVKNGSIAISCKPFEIVTVRLQLS